MTEHLEPGDPVSEWLLEGDPSVRWQVLRDLLDAPEELWRAERARVASEGDGARLLALADADGQWAGGAYVPAGFAEELWRTEGQPWTATSFSLTQLREFGLDPRTPRIREIVRLVGENSRWDHEGQPFWEGEVEECVNARTLTDGTYFGLDLPDLTARLLSEQQPDGGWNCERANGSLRSSFDTTINVLEAFLELERAGRATADVREARHAGEEFLLERALFRRLSTGDAADPDFLRPGYPHYWRYDVLRGAEHLRAAGILDGTAPDPRLTDVVEHLRSLRRPDGRWYMDFEFPGRVWFRLDQGVGRPSRWITLKALRVLRWWDAHQDG